MSEAEFPRTPLLGRSVNRAVKKLSREVIEFQQTLGT